MIKNRPLDHIGLAVTDVEADALWYQQVLGFKVKGKFLNTGGIEGIQHFWENGCKYFKILSPTGEQEEFCQVL